MNTLWTQFVLQNIHFGIYLFSALVFFGVFWLYADAWTLRKPIRELPRLVGFLILGVSLVLGAGLTEFGDSEAVSQSFWLNQAVYYCHMLGLLGILIGAILDPIQAKPTHGQKKNNLGELGVKAAVSNVNQTVLEPAKAANLLVNQATKSTASPESSTKSKVWGGSATMLIWTSGLTVGSQIWLPMALPLLSGMVAVVYAWRATKGLERHVRPMMWGFLALTLSELLQLGIKSLHSDSVTEYKLWASFGPVWLLAHGFLLLAALIIGKWVWYYLLKRVQTQLIMVFSLTTLVVFCVTTLVFTGVLVRSVENQTKQQLGIQAKTLVFALQGIEEMLLSDVRLISAGGIVLTNEASGSAQLSEEVTALLESKHYPLLLVTNVSGRVLAQVDQFDRNLVSLSEEPLVKRALEGELTTTAVVREGSLTPQLWLQASAPIKEEGEIRGVVVLGQLIDDPLVAGIQATTGLEATIYAGDVVTTSTLVGEGSSQPWIGSMMPVGNVIDSVLNEGSSFQGKINLLNMPLVVGVEPIVNYLELPVGMVMVAVPELMMFLVVGQSINLTFLVAALLMGLSLIPSTWLAKYIARQIQN